MDAESLDRRISRQRVWQFLFAERSGHVHALFRQFGLRLSSGSVNLEQIINTKICECGGLFLYTSLTISSTFDFPNAFCKSLLFATSPFDTFTKTLLICRTSSKFVSLENENQRLRLMDHNWWRGSSHSRPPFLYFVLVACDLVFFFSV